MGCLSGLTKYLLFFFNFVISICAIILIVFGAMVLIDNNDKGIETSFSIGVFTIAIGVIIFLVAFFGFCGAIQENSCMLTTYAVILICLFILQVILGVLVFISIKNDDGQFKKHIHEITEKIFNSASNNQENQLLVDKIQSEFKCCGANGPQIISLSSSCCGGQTPCTFANSYQTSCTDAIMKNVMNNMKIIGAVAFGFAVVELLGAIFACVVRNRSYK